jgi:hypothetical protein
MAQVLECLGQKHLAVAASSNDRAVIACPAHF